MRSPESKIRNLEQATDWRGQLRDRGRRLVATNGCFDLLHRGHVEYLSRARTLGDALLVGINTDAAVAAIKGPGRPVVPETDRAYLLASLEAIDAVVLFGSDVSPDFRPTLAALLPDVYVKGGDYTLDTINQEERVLLERLGIRIEFVPVTPGLSTTEVIRRVRSG